MEDSFLIEMGRRIQDKRKLLRLSQEEVAERAELTKQTVSRAENGQRELGAKNVARLAKALGMSTDYLLNGERTEVDVRILDRKIASLTDRQYSFLEDIIKNFIDICEEGSV
jgi:transcriptional regulator with XRE-family HTH domain